MPGSTNANSWWPNRKVVLQAAVGLIGLAVLTHLIPAWESATTAAAALIIASLAAYFIPERTSAYGG